jgi:hypothetical protein
MQWKNFSQISLILADMLETFSRRFTLMNCIIFLADSRRYFAMFFSQSYADQLSPFSAIFASLREKFPASFRSAPLREKLRAPLRETFPATPFV